MKKRPKLEFELKVAFDYVVAMEKPLPVKHTQGQ